METTKHPQSYLDELETQAKSLLGSCGELLDNLDLDSMIVLRETTETALLSIQSEASELRNSMHKVVNDIEKLDSQKANIEMELDNQVAQLTPVIERVNVFSRAIGTKIRSIHTSGVNQGKAEEELLLKKNPDANTDTPIMERIFTDSPRELKALIDDSLVLIDQYAKEQAIQLNIENTIAEKTHEHAEIEQEINKKLQQLSGFERQLNGLKLKKEEIIDHHIQAVVNKLRRFGTPVVAATAEVEQIVSISEGSTKVSIEAETEAISSETDNTDSLDEQNGTKFFDGIEDASRVRLILRTTDSEIVSDSVKVGGKV
jgi:hypothetical protein